MGAHYYYPRPSSTHAPIHFGPALIGMTMLICFVYVVVWAHTLVTNGPARNLRA